MTARRTPAVVVAVALAASVLLGAAGCGTSADDRRADYCDAVEQQSEHVRKTVAEGGPGAPGGHREGQEGVDEPRGVETGAHKTSDRKSRQGRGSRHRPTAGQAFFITAGGDV